MRRRRTSTQRITLRSRCSLRRNRSNLLEHDLLWIPVLEVREVRLDGHAVEHFAEACGGFAEVGDLPFAQIDGERTDLARLVPRTVLMRDRDDARGAVRFDERFDAPAEE